MKYPKGCTITVDYCSPRCSLVDGGDEKQEAVHSSVTQLGTTMWYKWSDCEGTCHVHDLMQHACRNGDIIRFL